MAENKIHGIAKSFGFELGEQFNIVNVNYNPFVFTKDGLFDICDFNDTEMLLQLLLGKKDAVKIDVEPIQIESLDKETPMKPVMLPMNEFEELVTSILCCVRCSSPIVNVWNKKEYKPLYCHYCGQKIDWDDE